MLLALLASVTANGQSLQKGDRLIKVGLALGTADFSQDFIPGLSVNGEFITKDDFGNGSLGLGFVAGTMSRRFNRIEGGITNIGTVRNHFGVLRGTWYPHKLSGDILSVYLSLNVGVRKEYRVGTFAGFLEDIDAFKIGHGYSVGVHVHLKEHLGAYIDLGFGLSNIGLGLYYNIRRNYKTMSSTVSR